MGLVADPGQQFRVVHLRGLVESDCCTVAVAGDLAHKQKDIDVAMGGLTKFRYHINYYKQRDIE
jgi:hypothetical protein